MKNRGRARFVRETADVRRQALIDATAVCLAEKGVGGTSVRGICTQAGVSAGLLSHYFDGIDALIIATYRDVGNRVAQAMEQAVLDAGSDAREQLRGFVLASFRPPVLDSDLLGTWIAFWSLVKSSPPVAAVHADIYGASRKRMEALLAAAGPAKSDGQIRLDAVALTALLDGLWLELCLDSSSFSADEAVEIADRWITATLHSNDGPID